MKKKSESINRVCEHEKKPLLFNLKHTSSKFCQCTYVNLVPVQSGWLKSRCCARDVRCGKKLAFQFSSLSLVRLFRQRNQKKHRISIPMSFVHIYKRRLFFFSFSPYSRQWARGRLPRYIFFFSSNRRKIYFLHAHTYHLFATTKTLCSRVQKREQQVFRGKRAGFSTLCSDCVFAYKVYLQVTQAKEHINKCRNMYPRMYIILIPVACGRLSRSFASESGNGLGSRNAPLKATFLKQRTSIYNTLYNYYTLR